MSDLYQPKNKPENKALELDEMRKLAKLQDSDIKLAANNWRSDMSGKGKKDYVNLLDDSELEEEE